MGNNVFDSEGRADNSSLHELSVQLGAITLRKGREHVIQRAYSTNLGRRRPALEPS